MALRLVAALWVGLLYYPSIGVSATEQTAPTRKAPPGPTLFAGCPAPALHFSEWLQGEPIPRFEPGKVYVIEFWATWCGFCKLAMPHLSDLAARYEGKVTVISMDVRQEDGDLPKVERFFTYARGLMAHEHVAVDTTDRYMEKQWLEASDNVGIPCSFIVDGEGKIAWIGYPVGPLEKALKLVLDHKLTLSAAKRINDEAAYDVGDGDGYLDIMQRAMKLPDGTALAVYSAEQAMKLDPIDNYKSVPAKYRALAETDPVAAKDFVQAALADKVDNAPGVLEALASTLVAKDNPKPDPVLAEKVVAEMMKNSDPEDPDLFAIRARVKFAKGDVAAAVSLQKRLVGERRAQADVIRKELASRPDVDQQVNGYVKASVVPEEEVLREYEKSPLRNTP